MKSPSILASPFMLLAVLALWAGHFIAVTAGDAWPDNLLCLDLPDGCGVAETDGDEDTPIIEIYEDSYEGDAFFFCLDRSSSMGNTTASGATKFALLKREVIEGLRMMPGTATVSVVFYDFSAPLVFGDPPISMDPAGKAALIGKVQSTPRIHGSCMLIGMLKILELADKSKAENRVIILIGDGRTHCSNAENDPMKVFEMIMQKNPSRIPINTIYTGSRSGPDWTIGKDLLERLSRATNGKFKIAHGS